MNGLIARLIKVDCRRISRDIHTVCTVAKCPINSNSRERASLPQLETHVTLGSHSHVTVSKLMQLPRLYKTLRYCAATLHLVPHPDFDPFSTLQPGHTEVQHVSTGGRPDDSKYTAVESPCAIARAETPLLRLSSPPIRPRVRRVFEIGAYHIRFPEACATDQQLACW